MTVSHHTLALCALKAEDKDQSLHSLAQGEPDTNERVIVVTRRFRCLGFLDELGIWRHHIDNAPIENVRQWTRNPRAE